ncbi:DUF1365 domain-containing protein [Mesorhizobium sp. 113-3-9]|uniref:DUF1365 domain-containing protein n=1 Tax=Mesorhizobium sp. 113-3-9 TaxID=2744517 RepID=UPI001FD34C98|nr:DUF1365 domain-containing protein [Mesorhizobium sp. 113-3-9]
MTWKIVTGIRWEALKLWPTGARFRSSPPRAEPMSYRARQGCSNLANDPRESWLGNLRRNHGNPGA